MSLCVICHEEVGRGILDEGDLLHIACFSVFRVGVQPPAEEWRCDCEGCEEDNEGLEP